MEEREKECRDNDVFNFSMLPPELQVMVIEFLEIDSVYLKFWLVNSVFYEAMNRKTKVFLEKHPENIFYTVGLPVPINNEIARGHGCENNTRWFKRTRKLLNKFSMRKSKKEIVSTQKEKHFPLDIARQSYENQTNFKLFPTEKDAYRYKRMLSTHCEVNLHNNRYKTLNNLNEEEPIIFKVLFLGNVSTIIFQIKTKTLNRRESIYELFANELDHQTLILTMSTGEYTKDFFIPLEIIPEFHTYKINQSFTYPSRNLYPKSNMQQQNTQSKKVDASKELKSECDDSISPRRT